MAKRTGRQQFAGEESRERSISIRDFGLKKHRLLANHDVEWTYSLSVEVAVTFGVAEARSTFGRDLARWGSATQNRPHKYVVTKPH